MAGSASALPSSDNRPERVQVNNKIPAKVNVKLLHPARIGIVDARHGLHRLEMCSISSAVTSENDYRSPGVSSRAPYPVADMVADGFRETVPGAKEIHRSSFSIVIGEDRCTVPRRGG